MIWKRQGQLIILEGLMEERQLLIRSIKTTVEEGFRVVHLVNAGRISHYLCDLLPK
jgi:hypothetical protein